VRMTVSRAAPRLRRVALGLTLVGVLAGGCGPDSPDRGLEGTDEGAALEAAAPPTAGAAALGPRVKTLDDLARRIQTTTGSCSDAQAADRSDIPGEVGNVFEHADRERIRGFLPAFTRFVVGLGECTVNHPDGSTLWVDMVLFADGSFVEVQKLWKAHSATGSPNSHLLWGNGYAIGGLSSHEDTAAALGLRYLRCNQTDALGGQRIPADVSGCFFTTVR
jgi:hypothetical protein